MSHYEIKTLSLGLAINVLISHMLKMGILIALKKCSLIATKSPQEINIVFSYDHVWRVWFDVLILNLFVRLFKKSCS